MLSSSDIDSHSYQVIGGLDQGKFSIGGENNKELVFNDGLLNFETKSSYQVTVSAIDSNDLSHNETFIITINNLNEPPIITSNKSFLVEENSLRITALVAEDEDQPTQELSFSLSGGADRGLFILDSQSGELSFKSTPDFEIPGDSNKQNNYFVEITVDDGNGETYIQSLSIQIEDMAEAPDLSDQSVVLDKQSGIGAVVSTLTATDPDQNESFTYSIVDGDALNAFTIDDTGKLVVSNPELLANQDNSVVSLVVQVTDSQGLTDTSTVKINIEALLKTESIKSDDTVTPDVVEVKAEEDFAYSVLTNLSSDSVEPALTNTITENKAGVSDSVEQLEPENSTVEAVENPSFILDDNHGIQSALEESDNKIKIGFVEEMDNFGVSQKAEERWASESILIKTQAVIDNNKIIPQFSYFDIESKVLQYLIEESGGFSKSLDLFREQQEEMDYLEKTVVGSSITVTTGLSIGYVIWLVRGGVLLSTALSSLPAWRMIDPLPVITSLNNVATDNDKNSDSLASLIKKGSQAAKVKLKLSSPSVD